MKDIKYQTLTISQAVTAVAVNKLFNVELSADYPFCTGIVFFETSPGVGTNVKLGIEDDGKKLLNPIPQYMWDIGNVESGKLFRKCFIRAGGNNIDVSFSCDAITGSAYSADFIFCLERELEESDFELNFQHKRIVVPNGTSTKWESSEFDLNSVYDKVAGFNINCSKNVRIGIKNISGEILLDSMFYKMLDCYSIPYRERFFPVDFKAAGQSIKIEVEPLSALTADLNIDLVFELERKICKK